MSMSAQDASVPARLPAPCDPGIQNPVSGLDAGFLFAHPKTQAISKGRVAKGFATRPKAFHSSRRDTITAPMGRFHPAPGRISHVADVFHWPIGPISLGLLHFATVPCFFSSPWGGPAYRPPSAACPAPWRRPGWWTAPRGPASPAPPGYPPRSPADGRQRNGAGCGG